jgi:hypothetical protein
LRVIIVVVQVGASENLTLNAQGLRVIMVVVQIGASENICSSSEGAQEK